MIQPKLRFFDLTMIIVSMVIGIGIFRNPSIIAKSAGSESIFFLAWVVGALVSICGALTFAEIGSRFPVAGGYYKMFSLCYHPAIAFMFIWTYIMLDAGATASVALTGAQYIAPVILPASLQNGMGDKLMFFLIVGILFFSLPWNTNGRAYAKRVEYREDWTDINFYLRYFFYSSKSQYRTSDRRQRFISKLFESTRRKFDRSVLHVRRLSKQR